MRLKDEYEHVLKILKPYQKNALEWISLNKRGLLEADTGAGKTLMLLTALVEHILIDLEAPHKVIIICSKNAMNTWEKEIQKWYPALLDILPLHSTGNYTTKTARDKLWETFEANQKGIFLTTYAIFRSDFKKVEATRFNIILLDEAHRGGLRNHKSATYNLLLKIKYHPSLFIWTSATLLDDSPMDLFPSCHLANPKKFKSYWGFAGEYCTIVDSLYGKQITGLRKPELFASSISTAVHRIPSAIIENQKPKLTRIKLYNTLTAKQRKVYETLDIKQLYFNDVEDILVAIKNRAATITKLRQLLCCPAIIDPTLGTGNIPELIADKLEDIMDKHCVIFVPFKHAADYYAEAFKIKFPNTYVGILRGGVELNDMRRILNDWKSKRGILICTIKFAESYECETAKNIFFAGFDYEPNANIQAEGRVHRMITKHNINAYYILNNHTIDEQIYDIINEKYHAKQEILKFL